MDDDTINLDYEVQSLLDRRPAGPSPETIARLHKIMALVVHDLQALGFVGAAYRWRGVLEVGGRRFTGVPSDIWPGSFALHDADSGRPCTCLCSTHAEAVGALVRYLARN